MPSAIDITKPVAGSPTTLSVRQNFSSAKTEIEALQLASYLQTGLGVIHIKQPPYNAACNGTSDDTSAVVAAIAALPSGGTLLYSGTPLLSSSITINKPIRLVGVGACGINASTLPASYFIKKSTMTTSAIIITNDGVILEGGGVVGQVGNTGDNITVTANGVLCISVYSQGAGQDGFRHGQDAAGGNNANSCNFLMCRSISNGRYGFYSRDGDSDNNVSTWLACVAQTNTSDGFRNGTTSGAQGSNNKYINCVGEANTGQGINIVGGTSNAIDGGDYESNTAGQILIGVDAVSTLRSNIRSAFTVVDNSTTTINLDTFIQKQGVWTPVLAGDSVAGTQTYGAQAGTYVRLGNEVEVTCRITLTAKDAATAGNMRITGLPFAYPSGFTNGNVGGSISQWGNITFPANYTQLCVQLLPNEQFFRLTRGGSAQTAAFVAAAEIGATSQVFFSAKYPIVQG